MNNSLPPATACESFGVYTLANDRFIDWFLCFVKSFREFNPTLPLTLIPYGGSLSKIHALTYVYNFTILNEADCLQFDSLADIVMGSAKGAGMFRKWACFFGKFDRFIFLDADIAVVSCLQPLLTAFSSSDYDFLYFDNDMSCVYNEWGAQEMVQKYGSHGFNAGTFVSRKNLIGFEELFAVANSSAQDRDKFRDHIDQPFLNYVMDVSAFKVGHVRDVLSTLSNSVFISQEFTFNPNDRKFSDSSGNEIPLIHWAGQNYPIIKRTDLFFQYRLAGDSRQDQFAYFINFYASQFIVTLLITYAELKFRFGQFLINQKLGKFIPSPFLKWLMRHRQ